MVENLKYMFIFGSICVNGGICFYLGRHGS